MCFSLMVHSGLYWSSDVWRKIFLLYRFTIWPWSQVYGTNKTLSDIFVLRKSNMTYKCTIFVLWIYFVCQISVNYGGEYTRWYVHTALDPCSVEGFNSKSSFRNYSKKVFFWGYFFWNVLKPIVKILKLMTMFSNFFTAQFFFKKFVPNKIYVYCIF